MDCFFYSYFCHGFLPEFFLALSSNRTIKERRAYELEEKNVKENSQNGDLITIEDKHPSVFYLKIF